MPDRASIDVLPRRSTAQRGHERARTGWFDPGRIALARVALVVMLGLACQSNDGTADATTSGDDGERDTTAPESSTTFATPDECMNSQDCETGGLCVAPFDPGGDDARGGAACVGSCIEENDLQSWCIDDASCCDNLACNRVDGFCEPRGLAGSTGTSGGFGTTGTGTTGGTAGDSSGTAGSGGTSSGSSTAASDTSGDTSGDTTAASGEGSTTAGTTAGASGTTAGEGSATTASASTTAG